MNKKKNISLIQLFSHLEGIAVVPTVNTLFKNGIIDTILTDNEVSLKSLSLNKFYESAKNLKIEIVLTAHPTEVKRRTLIQKFANVNGTNAGPCNAVPIIPAGIPTGPDGLGPDKSISLVLTPGLRNVSSGI